ncbi:MAG: SURF1 family protein [Actinomycetota bacterium]
MANSFDTSVLRQPRWIAAVLVGAVLALLFVRLAFWQLDRLDERRAQNATTEERMSEPARPLVGILGQYGDDAGSMADRYAIAEGTFSVADEFFSIGRTYDTLTGTLVATPFDLADGSVLIVVRGLVPPGTQGPPAVGFQPADRSMTIEGVLREGESPSAISDPEPVDGHLESVSRLDLTFIDRWVGGDVLPVMMYLGETTVRNPAGTPEPIPQAEISEGPHLGYAVQWFAFALIVAVGVAVLVYRAGTVSESDPDRTSRQ